MNTFQRVERNVVSGMIQRAALLDQPNEFFCTFFNGRVPTVHEKIRFVEHAMVSLTAGVIYQNDTYAVEVIQAPPFVHLDIRRLDGEPCKSWRDFQRIKNELVGPEHEAVELFPAEGRLVDTANQYHLWVAADPQYRFPFGFNHRLVLSEPMMVAPRPDGSYHVTGGKLLDQTAGTLQ